MATKRLINVNNNGTQQEYSGVTVSVGAGSSGEIPALDSTGKIDPSMLPIGIGADAVSAEAGESLSAGDIVYFDSTGKVMKAEASTIAKAGRGYVTQVYTSGATATVYFDDSNPSLTGLTPGSTYYLSTTAGQVTTTPPTTTNSIVQEIGFASSATNLRVNIQEPIIRV